MIGIDDRRGVIDELRGLRIATPVIAPLVAAIGVTAAHRVPAVTPILPVLIALSLVMIGALTLRVMLERRRRGSERPRAGDHFDILTGTGASTIWLGAAALIAAPVTGWASLSVIGILGLGTVCLAATWTSIAAGGDGPWRRAEITRTILPELAVEGDPLREEVRLAGVRIPAGMRLFATGWTMPHGMMTRYALDSDASRAELRLESEIGPAVRGEHRAPAMTMWLGDLLGLTRTPVIHRGEARFVVLPRPATIRGALTSVGAGGEDANAQPVQRQPTEGTFRIREYAPGDDTRRIHWVRSLQSNGLVVRLPDELPQAEPEIHLILDNELRGTESLTCRAPQDLLDALVQVWLGVARSLARSGRRVTLVTAVEHRGLMKVAEQSMSAHAPQDALRLGGRVTWQARRSLASVVLDGAAKQVIVSARPRELASKAQVSWIVVPEVAWIPPEPVPHRSPGARLPFPIGSADNRRSRRQREQHRLDATLQDRALFSQVMCWVQVASWSGHVVARPHQGAVDLAVIP